MMPPSSLALADIGGLRAAVSGHAEFLETELRSRRENSTNK